MAQSQTFTATGSRKTSCARVTLVKTKSAGKITINKKPLETYFPSAEIRAAIEAPLQATELLGKVDVNLLISGGGFTGQKGAAVHGIARALVRMDAQLRPTLRKLGYLTRDSRMVERQKPGQKGARARFTWVKR